MNRADQNKMVNLTDSDFTAHSIWTHLLMFKYSSPVMQMLAVFSSIVARVENYRMEFSLNF